jgi:ABC-type Fe3+-siderophore transport system permease subunit
VTFWKGERKINGRGQYSVRVEGVKYGASFGTALAIAISSTTNHLVLWAIIHGIFSWLYVIYFALFRA